MASIEAEGFVQEVKGNWLIKFEEPHQRKREDGNGYETLARTFRDVKIPRGSALDFSEFQEQDRIRVKGREVTEFREHQGKKHYTLTVWADEVELLWRANQRIDRTQENQPIEEPWQTTPSSEWTQESPF